MLYYSNNILSKALPDVGPYVSLGITIVNFFMTAAPIFLIDVCAFLLFPALPVTRRLPDCSVWAARSCCLSQRPVLSYR